VTVGVAPAGDVGLGERIKGSCAASVAAAPTRRAPRRERFEITGHLLSRNERNRRRPRKPTPANDDLGL
jgi:hypothetical protein